jgi:SLBB domain
MMKATLECVLSAVACWSLPQVLMVAARGEQAPRAAVEASRAAETTQSGKAGGTWIPALTGERRPLCRLRKTDALKIDFTFAPEFQETTGTLLDAFTMRNGLPDLVGEDASVPDLREAIRSAYAATPHDPDVAIVLEDSDQSSFMITGQIMRAGKYKWRAQTTVDQAIAMAGGRTDQASPSRVLLLRRLSDQRMEACWLNVKYTMNTRSLREDTPLEPGDLIFVPQNSTAEIGRFRPSVWFLRETAAFAEAGGLWQRN